MSFLCCFDRVSAAPPRRHRRDTSTQNSQKNNTGARLVRADHEIDPEERPQGDFDQGFIRANLLRPARDHRLLRGRLRAGGRTLHITGKNQSRLTPSADRGSGLLALRRPDQLRVHPDRVHPALRELRVVRLDDFSFTEVARREEVTLFKSRSFFDVSASTAFCARR